MSRIKPMLRGHVPTEQTRATCYQRLQSLADIQIVSDPTGDYEAGALFGLSDFCYGLNADNWPEGMTFKKGDHLYQIRGGQVVNESGGLVDVGRFWNHTGTRIRWQ